MQAGYRRPVFIYHIIALGTIDEDIMLALRGEARSAGHSA
jgi:hypothetical protein